MPGTITKLPGKDCYRVTWGGKVTAKCTTLMNAKRQLRLLNAIKSDALARDAGVGVFKSRELPSKLKVAAKPAVRAHVSRKKRLVKATRGRHG